MEIFPELNLVMVDRTIFGASAGAECDRDGGARHRVICCGRAVAICGSSMSWKALAVSSTIQNGVALHTEPIGTAIAPGPVASRSTQWLVLEHFVDGFWSKQSAFEEVLEEARRDHGRRDHVAGREAPRAGHREGIDVLNQ